jgi:hypothetical protein
MWDAPMEFYLSSNFSYDKTPHIPKEKRQGVLCKQYRKLTLFLLAIFFPLAMPTLCTMLDK